MTTEQIDILRKALGKYRKVRVSRRTEDESDLDGFVLGLSDELLALYVFIDFNPDGCYLLRLEDIEGVRSDDSERAFERVLAAEGLLDAVGIRDMPPLGTMQAALTHLAERGENIIVEAEDLVDEAIEEDSSYAAMATTLEEMLADLRKSEAEGVPFDAWPKDDETESARDHELALDDDTFLVGRAIRVEGEDFYLHHFDATGVWDEEPTPIAVDRITRVQLESPYMQTWLKHIAPYPGLPTTE